MREVRGLAYGSAWIAVFGVLADAAVAGHAEGCFAGVVGEGAGVGWEGREGGCAVCCGAGVGRWFLGR